MSNAEESMDSKLSEAKETFQILSEMSKLLNTGLDQKALSICIQLCESGINPQTLAVMIIEMKKQADLLKNNKPKSTKDTSSET